MIEYKKAFVVSLFIFFHVRLPSNIDHYSPLMEKGFFFRHRIDDKIISIIETTMNETVDHFSNQAVCEICQISYGFTSADRRSIIVMVVLTSIALILCYVGVLWYAIRTRFIPEDKLPITPEAVHKNQAFDDQDGDVESNLSPKNHMTTTQPAVFTIENDRERL